MLRDELEAVYGSGPSKLASEVDAGQHPGKWLRHCRLPRLLYVLPFLDRWKTLRSAKMFERVHWT